MNDLISKFSLLDAIEERIRRFEREKDEAVKAKDIAKTVELTTTLDEWNAFKRMVLDAPLAMSDDELRGLVMKNVEKIVAKMLFGTEGDDDGR